jgi:hypothetical protein
MRNPNYRPFRLTQWSTRVREEDKGKVILRPISGKVYNCPQEVQSDWDNYKNFYMPGKGYFDKSDLETMRLTHLHMKGQEVRVKFRKGESCIVDVL